jgi:lipase
MSRRYRVRALASIPDSVRLHLHEWGDPQGAPIVCLHGITGHGGRFARLAARLGGSYRVLAPDLRGHGLSGREPPWDLDTHLADVVETAGVETATWIGHSYGARLVGELAARDPQRVERAVLLDPALQVLPHVAEQMAEEDLRDVSFATVDEAIDARLASGRLFHTPRELLEDELPAFLEQGRDGRIRYRHFRPAVAVAWSEMAKPPPPYARVPTLLVLGAQSWIVSDEQREEMQRQLGDLLEVVTVRGGHVVLWDALDETADAVRAFLVRRPL